MVILIPGKKDEEGSKPMNVAYPSRVVSTVNDFIDGAYIELFELEQLPKKTLRK